MASESDSGLAQMKKAVNDLWSSIVREGANEVIFHDHSGSLARIREEAGGYRIAWLDDQGEPATWQESDRNFDNPRQAALYAFQGHDRQPD